MTIHLENLNDFEKNRGLKVFEYETGVMKINQNIIAPDIRMIVAMDQNQLIGVDNNLPWHLPLDLQLFKVKTLYQHILMGYNTFASIIQRAGKPLPQRMHWVLTRKNIAELPVYEHVIYISDIRECLFYLIQTAEQNALRYSKHNPEQLWVIGGSQVYETVKDAPWLHQMHITHIHKNFEGDAYLNMSKQDWQSWQIIEEKPILQAYQSSQHYLETASQMPLFQTFVTSSEPTKFKVNPALNGDTLSIDERQTTVKIYQRL